MLRWLMRGYYPVVAGRLNLAVMSAAFTIFGLSLIFQAHRWGSTPAYHVLLQIFPAQVWGALFLAPGAAMAAAVWRFGDRWIVVTALTAAGALTTGWMLAFVVRYLSSPNTTPETWVSWAVFDFLLVKVAISVDRPPPAHPPQASEFRQAIDDVLSDAARSQKASVQHAMDAEWDRCHTMVAVACAAYVRALAAALPAPGTEESPQPPRA